MSKKYNRTPHLPWSLGATNDDKIARDIDCLINNTIIITEKIDGSNCSLEYDNCYARTHSGAPTHASFDHIKALHSTIKHHIPRNIQLFGENCYALHSIPYSELPGYFLLFNVREKDFRESDRDFWVSWYEVELWAEIIGVPTVPVLFKGQVSSENELKKLTESLMIEKSKCGGIREGVVVRVADNFPDDNFKECVMKSVRENHVNTSDHWMHNEITKNKLKA